MNEKDKEVKLCRDCGHMWKWGGNHSCMRDRHETTDLVTGGEMTTGDIYDCERERYGEVFHESAHCGRDGKYWVEKKVEEDKEKKKEGDTRYRVFGNKWWKID
jgi:hypothetical protein